MISGELDQILTFQTLAETNVDGQLERVWTTDTSRTAGQDWAKVITERGDEAIKSARLDAEMAVRVKMRYRDDITTAWRFIWEGTTFYIKEVDRSLKRKGELWLSAKAQSVS